jgi:hypothetical protein
MERTHPELHHGDPVTRAKVKLAAVIFGSLALLQSASALAAGRDEDTVNAVKKLLPETPGACVLVADRGQIVFQHAYGLADVEDDVAATSTTNFRMASVSKQFTAACIMLLVDQGKLKLDDTLDKFFPGFPEWGRKITVRHLLLHTSGLPDYENLIPDGTKLQLDDLDVLHILMDAKKPLFAPDEKWQYSNSGYTLLGLIVEVASGQPFHEFMAEQIFRPLHMDDSVMYVRGLNGIDRRAYGHEKKEGKWVRADQSLTSAIRPFRRQVWLRLVHRRLPRLEAHLPQWRHPRLPHHLADIPRPPSRRRYPAQWQRLRRHDQSRPEGRRHADIRSSAGAMTPQVVKCQWFNERRTGPQDVS